MERGKVHYEAPPSERIPAEMKAFITWFNETGPGGKAEIKSTPVRSAVAHLYFETIPPLKMGMAGLAEPLRKKHCRKPLADR